MDLELVKFIFSSAFLVLLLVKQHLDGTKIQNHFCESKDVFKAMPKVTEASVDCLRRLHEQMQFLAQKLELLTQGLEGAQNRTFRDAGSDGKEL